MRNFTSQLCTSFRIIYASIQVAIEVVSVQIANAKLEIVIWLCRMDPSKPKWQQYLWLLGFDKQLIKSLFVLKYRSDLEKKTSIGWWCRYRFDLKLTMSEIAWETVLSGLLAALCMLWRKSNRELKVRGGDYIWNLFLLFNWFSTAFHFLLCLPCSWPWCLCNWVGSHHKDSTTDHRNCSECCSDNGI